jgi:hypothetical protein
VRGEGEGEGDSEGEGGSESRVSIKRLIVSASRLFSFTIKLVIETLGIW